MVVWTRATVEENRIAGSRQNQAGLFMDLKEMVRRKRNQERLELGA